MSADDARLFVALGLPARVREELAGWARELRSGLGSRRGEGGRESLRLVDAEAMHLTLCFVGSRPVGEIDALADALLGFEGGACELTVGAPLWLPPRRPRALAVEVHDGDGRRARTQARVCEALAAAGGWEPGRGRFRAHVTVARMREGALGSVRGRPLEPTPQLRFTGAEIVLYRSWLSPRGASYEALATCPLGAAG